MIKYSILLLNMLAIIFARTFFAGDVNVKMKAPKKVKQGEEITVTLTIDKGSIAGVGHMKQELPANFGNATVIDAKGAEFKYLEQDNVVKFTWISLPPEQEFNVSYKVVVAAEAENGNVNLGGKFSYVLNNEKQTFLLEEQSIQVGKEEVLASATPDPEPEPEVPAEPEVTEPEPTQEPVSEPEPVITATTENPDTSTQASSSTAAKSSVPVTASRSIVGSPEAGTEFTIELNVYKDGMKGFARIQEIIPVGLIAKPLENKGGTFSFVDQKVKIIWDNLPSDEDIKVAYRVVPSESSVGSMDITGSFSYVENDDPKKIEILATSFEVKAKTIIASTPVEPEPENPVVNSTEPTITASSVPEPELEIAYKIQICALSRIQRGTGYFENKFAIGNKVDMEFHEGWKKYIVGKYNQYQEARNYRETVKAKGVENPFVTAYNSGKRITVQEALMVSNQKWVP